MRKLFWCILCAALGGNTLAAQQTKSPPHIHQEPADLQRLNYFVGSWVLKANIEKGPAAEGGEFRQLLKVEWMKGEHFLISHSETQGSLGDTFGLVVTGFSAKEKKFVYHSFHSTGISERGTGTVEGKTWTWVSEPPEQEVRLQRRFTMTELTPDKYSFLLEITPDGKNWTTAMQGEAQKQQ